MDLHILKFVVSFHLGGGQDIEGISILWTNSVTRRGRAARRIGIDASSWRASILWDSPPPSRWSWRPATNWRTCCSVSAAWSWASSSSLSSKSSWRLLDCTRHKSGRGLRVTSVERTKRTSCKGKLKGGISQHRVLFKVASQWLRPSSIILSVSRGSRDIWAAVSKSPTSPNPANPPWKAAWWGNWRMILWIHIQSWYFHNYTLFSLSFRLGHCCYSSYSIV